ncbi:MAG: ATP synthase F1 subunit epsilon [Candidatus Goldiibacteriota bacterium]
MANLIHIDIVTPEKRIFEGNIKGLSAPGIDGEFGVLPGHAPFATILAPGVVSMKNEDNSEELMAVSGGYLEVTGEKIVLLVETADREGEVDVEKIKKRKEEKERLLKAKEHTDVDYDKIHAQLVHEMARLKAVRLLSRRKKV